MRNKELESIFHGLWSKRSAHDRIPYNMESYKNLTKRAQRVTHHSHPH